MMPAIAERYRLARVLGVEFPFGHSYGMPHRRDMQVTVVRAALDLFNRTALPVREDVPLRWPVDASEAIREWMPREPAPIIVYMREQARRRREEQAGGGNA